MSVQAGIWNFDGRPVDRKLLADISESLKHRGPDGESCHVDGSVALLYRPFHTTAESRREKQPYFSRRGFILTLDGRLDNRDELIPELRSELDANPTDVAIVSAAFDRWETDCFKRIAGDWAVSIWKQEQHELLFATDYMAIRHIFYYVKNNGVWWSTDLSPLVLLSGDKFHIDDDYIAGYFARGPDSYLTPYREIRQAPAGQFVRVRSHGGISVQRYWTFSPNVRIRYKTDVEYEEHFRHVFRQSVRRRLRSDSPILAELSGGLDSSSIVCIADDILAREKVQTPRLDTLSFFDKTEPNGEDWMYFPKVEERRGRVGTHIDVSNSGDSPASLEYSEFHPFPGYLGFGRKVEFERARATQNGGYRVIMSGIGGDEFLGGIPDPRAQLCDLIMQFRFITFAKELMAWSLVKRRPWIRLLCHVSMDFLPPSLGRHFVKEAEVERWLDKDFAKRTRLAIRQMGVTKTFGMWLPTRRGYVGGVLFMGNKMSKQMSGSLSIGEIRYPYLDQGLIEFILSIPARQLLRPGERRSLMRRSLLGVVPQEILSRRTKQFAARTPLVALEQNWQAIETAFDSSSSSELRFIYRDQLIETLEAAKSGNRPHIVSLMKAISLEFWLRHLASRSLVDVAMTPSKAASQNQVGLKHNRNRKTSDLSY
jgi:asparagine synthase (glutamine-hydrolysing)